MNNLIEMLKNGVFVSAEFEDASGYGNIFSLNKFDVFDDELYGKADLFGFGGDPMQIASITENTVDWAQNVLTLNTISVNFINDN